MRACRVKVLKRKKNPPLLLTAGHQNSSTPTTASKKHYTQQANEGAKRHVTRWTKTTLLFLFFFLVVDDFRRPGHFFPYHSHNSKNLLPGEWASVSFLHFPFLFPPLGKTIFSINYHLPSSLHYATNEWKRADKIIPTVIWNEKWRRNGKSRMKVVFKILFCSEKKKPNKKKYAKKTKTKNRPDETVTKYYNFCGTKYIAYFNKMIRIIRQIILLFLNCGREEKKTENEIKSCWRAQTTICMTTQKIQFSFAAASGVVGLVWKVVTGWLLLKMQVDRDLRMPPYVRIFVVFRSIKSHSVLRTRSFVLS